MKLAKNVVEKMNGFADDVAKYKRGFYYSNFCEDYEDEIVSPIERILYGALGALILMSLSGRSECNSVNRKTEEYITQGFDVSSQCNIGKYKVDFMVSYVPTGYYISQPTVSNAVIVECDSQKWHERTEKQRRYEKKRDRFLIKEGYKVFHYTGKEIIDTPYKVAAEILSEVSGSNIDISKYIKE